MNKKCSMKSRMLWIISEEVTDRAELWSMGNHCRKRGIDKNSGRVRKGGIREGDQHVGKQDETQSVLTTRWRPQWLGPKHRGSAVRWGHRRNTVRPTDPCTHARVLRIFSPLAFLSPLTPAPSALRVSPSLLLIQLCTLSSYIPKSSLTLLPPHENTQALILG